VDTNILLYAHVVEFPLHGPAKEKLRSLSEGSEAWAIPVFCLGEFIRIITHPGLFKRPFSEIEAWDAVLVLIGSPSCRILLPGDRYVELLGESVKESGARGNMVFDAQIAALCRESGVKALLTEDRDFSRFQDFPVIRIQ
jgi:toxin-antitoxin system PIN domain toxin